jgi:hypothetical protein
VVWTEPATAGARLIVVENGEVRLNTDVETAATPPIPPGYTRSIAARREGFTVACFDRLRVLSTLSSNVSLRRVRPWRCG